MFWTYLLRCADGRYYAGHTDNLEHRIAQHQAGIGCAFTRHRRPVTVIWSENFPSREEALSAERRIKGWSQAKKAALAAGDWPALQSLARNRQSGGRPSTSSRRTVEGPEKLTPVRAEPVEARKPGAHPQ